MNMKITDHFDSYDPLDDDDDTPKSYNKSCNNCGVSGLGWMDDNGKWILVTRKGQVHKCKIKPMDLNEKF